MAFLFKLETTDGAPAEPPTLATAVPNWRSGDEIPLGRRGRCALVAFAMTTPINGQCWSLRTWLDESRGPQFDVPLCPMAVSGSACMPLHRSSGTE